MRSLPPVAAHGGIFTALFGMALCAGLAGCAGQNARPAATGMSAKFQSGTVLAVRPVPLPAAAPAALRIEALLGQVSAPPNAAREVIVRMKDGAIRDVVQTANTPVPKVGAPFALTTATP